MFFNGLGQGHGQLTLLAKPDNGLSTMGQEAAFHGDVASHLNPRQRPAKAFARWHRAGWTVGDVCRPVSPWKIAEPGDGETARRTRHCSRARPLTAHRGTMSPRRPRVLSFVLRRRGD